MPGDPHFPFDRSVPTYWPKTNSFFFSAPRRQKLRTFIMAIQYSQKKGFGRFLAWKEVFDYNNLLYGSIQIEFHHRVFLPVVKRLSFFQKEMNPTTATVIKFGHLAWPTTQLISEMRLPQAAQCRCTLFRCTAKTNFPVLAFCRLSMQSKKKNKRLQQTQLIICLHAWSRQVSRW